MMGTQRVAGGGGPDPDTFTPNQSGGDKSGSAAQTRGKTSADKGTTQNTTPNRNQQTTDHGGANQSPSNTTVKGSLTSPDKGANRDEDFNKSGDSGRGGAKQNQPSPIQSQPDTHAGD